MRHFGGGSIAFEKAVGVEDWADLSQGRCLTALWKGFVPVIPQGLGPGLGA
jgi:hypothetical protein